MADLFISYAHEDTDLVRELVHLFEANGSSVFWDRDIRSGSRFDTVIEKELAEARCVVACWSKHAVESYWVRAETQDALDRQILIAINLDGSLPALPFRFVNAIDLSRWPNSPCHPELQYVLASINRVLSKPDPESTSAVQPLRNVGTLSQRVAERVVSELAPSDALLDVAQLELEQVLNELYLRLLETGDQFNTDRRQLLVDVLATWQPQTRCGFWIGSELTAASPVSDMARLMTSDAVRQLLDTEGVLVVKSDEEGWELLKKEQLVWACRIPDSSDPNRVLLLTGSRPAPKVEFRSLARLGRVLDLL